MLMTVFLLLVPTLRTWLRVCGWSHPLCFRKVLSGAPNPSNPLSQQTLPAERQQSLNSSSSYFYLGICLCVGCVGVEDKYLL